tara:strand:+ start:4844 stop:6184 length:1341 start_codon:yes stop_codon:yes gene_type:complete
MIGKIVELLIDWDDMQFEDLGVEVMSLVDKPAIGISWQAFAAQQFVDPKAGETEADYIGRCIPTLIEEGFDEDQAAAICYNSYKGESFLEDNPCQSGYVAYGTKNKGGRQVPNCIPIKNQELAEIRENKECPDGFEHQMPDGSYMCGKEHAAVDPIIEMASHVDFGETLDYANTIEINQSQAKFDDLQDTLKAIIGLDILGKKDPKDEGEIKYRYSGPAGQRDFCKAMLRLNKVYTEDEIDRMAGLNPGFGPRGASRYDIFKYKGGPNCQHGWERVRVFREGRKTVVVSEGREDGLAGEAPERMPNSGYLMSAWNFSEDDKMIITGPAMTPNTLIPRRSEDGQNFHVYFTEDTIEKISKKFFEFNKTNNTDVNHDGDVVIDNTLLESWIVEDPEMDKSKLLGFDVPKGTWFVSYKINNQDTWQKIKDGSLNGFSIEGKFIEKATTK